MEYITMTTQINVTAFATLVSMGQAAKPAIKSVKAAKAELQGAYNLGVKAAHQCASAESFKATIEKLEDDIRHNRDGMAVKFGADKRDKVNERGERYKIPSSVSTVKTVCLFSFTHGVSLDDGNGNPTTFGVLRKLNTAVRDKLEADKAQTLTGAPLMVWQVQQAGKALTAKAADMSEAELSKARAALAPWIAALGDATSDEPEQSTSGAGEALAGEAAQNEEQAPKASKRTKKAA